MKILLTGATGFIGRSVLKYSGPNFEFVVLKRANSNESLANNIKECLIWNGDAQDLDDSLNRVKPDVILHLASNYQSDDRVSEFQTMVDASVFLPTILFSYASSAGIRIITAGTRFSMIGEGSPFNYYSLLKSFEYQLGQYFIDSDMNHVNIEIGDSYGNNDTRGKFLSSVLNAKKYQNPISIRNPNNYICPVYVKDVANEILNIISNSSKFPRRLSIWGPEGALTIKELLDMLHVTYTIEDDFNNLNRKIDEKLELKPVKVGNYISNLRYYRLAEGFEEVLSEQSSHEESQ